MRLLVDKRYQGRGIGLEALRQAATLSARTAPPSC
ncbi:hypothetical protein [Streptomyces sp. NPDC056628]